MNLADRIRSFEFLGDRLRKYHEKSGDPELLSLIEAAGTATAENPWFTPEHIRYALNNLGIALKRENLDTWIAGYDKKFSGNVTKKTVGVVMAGNIPAVGFHDFLCVLIAGHKLIGRLSSSDARLIPAMAAVLVELMPEWHDYIAFTTGKLEKFDAVIATGSNNTSRYFNFYFGRYPHIIRKNRNSVAILDGHEDETSLMKLAGDIMQYFGMGCRSVSKLYVPAGYDFSQLVKALGTYHEFVNHHKYCNNYEYGKSIFLVDQAPFLDTGFLLLKEDRALASRIAVLHYEFYHSVDEAVVLVKSNSDLIQCAVSTMPLPIRTVMPGEAQCPALWDYADQVDTIGFLLS